MVWGTKYGRFTPINISKYEHFTSKSIKLTHILCVRCILAISAVLSLLYRHCYSCQKTKSRLHIPISTVVYVEWFAPRKSSRSAFSTAIVYNLRPLHPRTCLNTKLPAHFAGNERFLPAFPSSLLSGYALDNQTGYGHVRDLGSRSIFSLPRVVRSINVQYLPHSHRDTSP